MGSLTANDVIVASNIAGISYSILILSEYIVNALNSKTYIENAKHPVMLQFIQSFKTQISNCIEKLLEFFKKEEDLFLFLNMFLTLVQKIDPDKFVNIKQITLEHFPEFYKADRSILEKSQHWTNDKNVYNSNVRYLMDFNPILHETPTAEFADMQEVARDATMLMKIRNVPSE
jgi:hypothetical protein